METLLDGLVVVARELFFHPMRFFGWVACGYALLAVLFILSARFSRREDGTLAVDPSAWHFRVAYYPLNSRRDPVRVVGLCRYFHQLLYRIFFWWPACFFLEGAKFVVYNAVLLAIGRYALVSICPVYVDAEDLFSADVYRMKPGWRGVALAGYVGLGMYVNENYPPYVHVAREVAYPWMLVVLGFISFLIGVIFVGAIWDIINQTQNHKVAIFRIFVRACYRRVCPLVVIEPPSE